MSLNRRRSSKRISLVLIGSVAVATVAECNREETRRDIYSSKESCLADWGNTPKDCEPAYEHPGSRGPNTYYYGRAYPFTGNSFEPRSTRSVGTTTVSRGGFGSSAHSASSTSAGG
jgi:uncharacterized protein YgiB involved in biofilm formation